MDIVQIYLEKWGEKRISVILLPKFWEKKSKREEREMMRWGEREKVILVLVFPKYTKNKNKKKTKKN